MNDKALMMNHHMFDENTVSHNRIISTPKLGVKAATLLRCDSTTETIDISRLPQANSIIQYAEIADADGRLYCVDSLVNPSNWVKIIAIAKDCQSSNVILMISARGVILKTMRVIIPGEPLRMWFTDNILRAMNIHSLLPANSHGDDYLCTICHATFSDPNPLKIHLALNCNKVHRNYLWTALAQEAQNLLHPANLLAHFQALSQPFDDELSIHRPQYQEQYGITNATRSKLTPCSASTPLESSLSSKDILASVSSTQATLASSSRNIDPLPSSVMLRGSAFQPNATISNVGNNRVETAPPRNAHDLPSAQILPYHEEPAMYESIISSLGKSNRGHICIYCGKFCSRKYGLKIHIRTHTGYKPLKCQYCSKQFGDPSNLNKHLKSHRENAAYPCTLCDEVLVNYWDFYRHIKSRHGEQVYHHLET